MPPNVGTRIQRTIQRTIQLSTLHFFEKEKSAKEVWLCLFMVKIVVPFIEPESNTTHPHSLDERLDSHSVFQCVEIHHRHARFRN